MIIKVKALVFCEIFFEYGDVHVMWANLIKSTTGTIKVLIGLYGCEGSWPASHYYKSSREYLRKQVTPSLHHTCKIVRNLGSIVY